MALDLEPFVSRLKRSAIDTTSRLQGASGMLVPFRPTTWRSYVSAPRLPHLTGWWRDLSLSRQFGLVAAIIVLLGMSAVGSWVARKIEEGVTNNSAIAATLYMDAFVAPLVQELTNQKEISPDNRKRLDEILALSEIRENIVSIKVWRPGAIVAYSNFNDIIGRSFTPTSHLMKAWNGVVSAELDGHSHDDDEKERSLGIKLLEIYAPIREAGSNRIIAVSEFYVRANKLQEALRTARLQSWAVVGSISLAMLLVLSHIVAHGSRIIELQQGALHARAVQNDELRAKTEQAYWRADKINEQFLRRLGADLHDGPAQLISYALMSLDDLPLDEAKQDHGSPGVHESIRKALDEAMRDIRSLSRGLIMPQLDGLTLCDAVSLIVRNHEERCGAAVQLELPAGPIEAPAQVKICIYRFVQEALNNAFKHANGKGQRIVIEQKPGLLIVSASDDGLGMSGAGAPRCKEAGLGLIGIRDRVETLAGRFEIISRPEGGTTLRATLRTGATSLVEG